jgi:hypothetical protein
LDCNRYLREGVVWWSDGVRLIAIAILEPA